jgi:hypothetical protein
MTWSASLPQWAQYLVEGLLIFLLMASSAIVLGRAGKSPWWALLMLVPYNVVVVALIWAFAFSKWPRIDGQKTPD